MLPLKMSLCLANAVQPAVFLIWIHWGFCFGIWCYIAVSQVNVVVKVLYLHGVDIYCRLLSSPMTSTSSSVSDFQFHQLAHVAFVVVHR